MSSFLLFGTLLIASHAFTAYIAYHEGYLKGYFEWLKDRRDAAIHRECQKHI